MSYFNDFERLFMRRSLELIEAYNGEYETTLLLNALVGLLFFPHERMRDLIPEIPVQALDEWGFNPGCIVNAGDNKDIDNVDLRELVRRLRNAVAHCAVTPVPNDDRPCEGFYFVDRNGFEADIPAVQLKSLMTHLLTHLLEQ